MSKKSWRDGTGGKPEKEEKGAKQKYFHSLLCEKWAHSNDFKISNKEVESFKSAFKMFLNSDSSNL